VIPTPPLRVRNRLAELILRAVEDADARGELAALGAPDGRAASWLAHDELAYARLVQERALSASAALAGRATGRLRSRADVLDAAARLFDAHLYFEVHELLEPAWRDAREDDREALQGLIQVAVGYQHLANGNFAGARALLEEGRARLRGRRLDGLDLEAFEHAVARSVDQLAHFDWRAVPAFPRLGSGKARGAPPAWTSTSERSSRES
jgi:predicted metal-dependent hydrolase